jgi:antitoxin component YwqK of YwqJK toxin-antitoxin module
MKNLFCCIVFIMFASAVNAQCKEGWFIGAGGDTINCTNRGTNKKEGKWIIRVEEVRGEAGYEEEGLYVGDRKEGLWKKFSLASGEKISEEYYRWGSKDGPCKYYSEDGDRLLRIESWMAIDPDRKGDTLLVSDPKDPSGRTMKKMIVPLNGISLKNGDWFYYDKETGKPTKHLVYKMDELQAPPMSARESNMEYRDENGNIKKPKEVIQFEKKKKKVADGSTGGGE